MSEEPGSLPAMPARWSADSVLALAPDDASRRAATPLGRPGQWTDAGAVGDLVWGLCAGSGKNPYQVIADLAGPPGSWERWVDVLGGIAGRRDVHGLIAG